MASGESCSFVPAWKNNFNAVTLVIHGIHGDCVSFRSASSGTKRNCKFSHFLVGFIVQLWKTAVGSKQFYFRKEKGFSLVSQCNSHRFKDATLSFRIFSQQKTFTYTRLPLSCTTNVEAIKRCKKATKPNDSDSDYSKETTVKLFFCKRFLKGNITKVLISKSFIVSFSLLIQE